jgi:hypothetical protein
MNTDSDDVIPAKAGIHPALATEITETTEKAVFEI